jgi:hypothetical protein
LLNETRQEELMRKPIGWGLMLFALTAGIWAGAIDPRVLVPSAHAMIKGGGGNSGGCDGKGAPASCAACTAGECVQVCVGSPECVTWFDKNGGKMCQADFACASGGGSHVGGLTIY